MYIDVVHTKTSQTYSKHFAIFQAPINNTLAKALINAKSLDVFNQSQLVNALIDASQCPN